MGKIYYYDNGGFGVRFWSDFTYTTHNYYIENLTTSAILVNANDTSSIKTYSVTAGKLYCEMSYLDKNTNQWVLENFTNIFADSTNPTVSAVTATVKAYASVGVTASLSDNLSLKKAEVFLLDSTETNYSATSVVYSYPNKVFDLGKGAASTYTVNHTFTNLTPGKSYKILVRAWDSSDSTSPDGNWNYAVSSNFTMPALPNPVTNLRVTSRAATSPATSGSTTLAWDLPTNTTLRYTYLTVIDKDDLTVYADKAFAVGAGATSYTHTVTGIPNNRNLEVSVSSDSLGGEGPNAALSTTSYVTPAAPAISNATSVGYTQFSTDWTTPNPGSGGLSKWRVRLTDPGNVAFGDYDWADQTVATNYKTFTGLGAGASYKLWVEAVDVNGYTVQSVKTFTTNADTSAPNPPAWIYGTYKNASTATIAWDDTPQVNDIGASGFNGFHVSVVPDGSARSFTNVGAVPQADYSGLVPGQRYELAIYSEDGALNTSAITVGTYFHPAEFLKRVHPKFSPTQRVYPRMKKRVYPRG